MKSHILKRRLDNLIEKFKGYINTLLIRQKLKKQGCKNINTETHIYKEGDKDCQGNLVNSFQLEMHWGRLNAVLGLSKEKDISDDYKCKFCQSLEYILEFEQSKDVLKEAKILKESVLNGVYPRLLKDMPLEKEKTLQDIKNSGLPLYNKKIQLLLELSKTGELSQVMVKDLLESLDWCLKNDKSDDVKIDCYQIKKKIEAGEYKNIQIINN